MTSVSVMMTVFVLNLHYRGPKKNEIPFWLQQLLSISVANTVRTFNRPKKLKLPCPNRKPSVHRESPQNRTKTPPQQGRVPTNGLLLSYTNINETRVRSRITTDVSSIISPNELIHHIQEKRITNSSSEVYNCFFCF